MMADKEESNALPQERKKPGRKRRWRRWLILLSALYVGWCAILFLFQSYIIYPGQLRPASQSNPPAGTEVMSLTTVDGQHVEAWFLPAPGCDGDHPCPAAMYFHGNAELIDDEIGFAFGYHKLGWSVLMAEYRGFGRAEGAPSQAAIRGDMMRFYDLLRQRPEVDVSRIVFHGRSLGGAIAADLAAHRRPAALILQSTFVNAGAMAHRVLVPGFLCRQPYRTDEVVRKLEIPVVVFHGTYDHVVPVSHGRRLAQLTQHAKYVEYPCNHNDLPPAHEEDAYWRIIRETLEGRRADP